MHIHITDSETGNNKGSSAQLVAYLEKENRMEPADFRKTELWFNNNSHKIEPQEVKVRIDDNIAKLGRDDAKFFLINISPSEKELLFLKQQFGEEEMKNQLKKYAERVMDAYAHNFKRKNIKNNTDLLWYAKLEHFRYYKYTDDEVKQGIVQAGTQKEGEQMHIQVIVSRKDITNKIKLSPMNNSRGKNEKHSTKLGQFDRVVFKKTGETIFDQLFGYDRNLKETVNYSITIKKGTVNQKQTAYLLQRIENAVPPSLKKSFVDKAKVIMTKTDFESDQLIKEFDFLNMDFKNNDLNIQNLIESFGGLFFQNQGEDYEEEQFAKRMKKKKGRKL